MSGIKGRSGVASTPEALAARREAGRLGGLAKKQARRDRVRAIHERKALEAEASRDPTATPPDLLDADLDATIPRPSDDLSSYPDGEGERQLAWARHWAAQRALLDYQTRRGELLTIEDVADRERDADRIIIAQIQTAVALATSLVPLADQDRARKAAQDWISQVRQAVADGWRARCAARERKS
jgi:hypothetical protein